MQSGIAGLHLLYMLALYFCGGRCGCGNLLL